MRATLPPCKIAVCISTVRVSQGGCVHTHILHTHIHIYIYIYRAARAAAAQEASAQEKAGVSTYSPVVHSVGRALCHLHEPGSSVRANLLMAENRTVAA